MSAAETIQITDVGTVGIPVSNHPNRLYVVERPAGI
jgi:hypothetical protein